MYNHYMIYSLITHHRTAAVDACRWVTQSVPFAPYVTRLPWVTHYGCRYVVHGDDITSDSSGEDCYRFVKAAGRFKVVKRTPSISTTDLVGRMLLCTRSHFIKSLAAVFAGKEGSGTDAEREASGLAMKERMQQYATDETGLAPGPSIWSWTASIEARESDTQEEKGKFAIMCQGATPKLGQRVVYVDGGFDLFSSGHIEFLRQVLTAEEKLAHEQGWYAKEAVQERTARGADYGPAFVVAGVHDDEVINHWKGINYPIMNIFERGLCVLQCKVSVLLHLMRKLTDCSTLTLSFSGPPLHLARRTSPRHRGEHPMLCTTAQPASCLSHMTPMPLPRLWASFKRLDSTALPMSMLVRLLTASCKVAPCTRLVNAPKESKVLGKPSSEEKN